uniref:Gasdermin-B isoform X1 n=3 Tax=Camelus TaxID=9836 RepID=A0A9W3HMS3_CAMBA|nr:gasdermin-B isoform X1 [Camelus bactrianus]
MRDGAPSFLVFFFFSCSLIIASLDTGTVQTSYPEGILTTSIFVGPGTLPMVFEENARAVVQEMDPGGDMIAVRSIIDADRFHCFCLVKKKKRFLGYQYDKTDLTLKDILEMEEGEELFDKLDSGLQVPEAECQLMDNVDSKGSETLTLLKKPIEMEFSRSWKRSTTLLKTWISPRYLDSLENRKLKRELPLSFRSIQNMKEDLYLVTETLETTKEETGESGKRCILKILMDFLNLQCEYKHQMAVTIPPKKVLGYRIKQLVFPNTETMSICFSGETKSFPEAKDGGSPWLGKSLSLEDFRNMEEKVQDMMRALQGLTEDERKEVLSCLTECLSRDEQLQDLQQRVSDVLRSGELQIEGPAFLFISSLFNAAGIFVEVRAEAIWDVLDAMTELSEERQLVAEVLEKGTLPLLKNKVESILKQDWREQPQDVGCDPQARTLYALYVVVSTLLQLGEKPDTGCS